MLGCLALPRMLAAHAALAPLQGNPKAIALAVSLLQRTVGTVGPARDDAVASASTTGAAAAALLVAAAGVAVHWRRGQRPCRGGYQQLGK